MPGTPETGWRVVPWWGWLMIAFAVLLGSLPWFSHPP